MAWTGKRQNWNELSEASMDHEDFIIPDVISSSTTLLYGESKVGKSYLVCSLIAAMATEGKFLDHPIETRPWKIAILGTDDNAGIEYQKRINTVLPDGMVPEIEAFQLPIMRTMEMWRDLYEVIINDGFNFIVLDNITQAINGDINSQRDVNEFFDGVRLFVHYGIPVLIIGHSSEKTGPGGKSTNPFGSSAVTQNVRHRIFAYKQNGYIFLQFKGNHISEEFRMKIRPEAGARFTVVEKKTLEEINARNAEKKAEREAKKVEDQQKKQERSKATLDRNEQIIQHVVDNCQGMKAAAVAKSIAEKFGGSVSTYTSNLSAGRSFASQLKTDGSGGWTRTEA